VQLTDCLAAFKHAMLMCILVAVTLTLVVQEACWLDLTGWLVVTGTAGLRSNMNSFMP